MILLSLASKQIWPHVLTVARLKPNRVFLLHSQDANESLHPAKRLKGFFDDSGLVPRGNSRLELVPHDNFTGIERALDTLVTKHHLPLPDCRLNFTGGNKLMATAAFRWAARRGVSSFYLERGNRLTRFEPRDGEMATLSEPLDGHIADNLNPVTLLRCQLDASEIQRPGQTLILNAAGSKLADAEFFKRLQNGSDMRPLICSLGEADQDWKPGDPLEFTAAAALLKLGVHRIQRSLRLKVKSSQQTGTRSPHAEIDLLFTWDGRLWLVDCKDRKPVEGLADALKPHLHHPIPSSAMNLFDRIRDELSIGETKAIKQDLLAIREAGGLLGNIVCVRKGQMLEEAVQYARNNNIEVILKGNLIEGLRKLILPNRLPSSEELESLTNVRTRASA